jgi:hypothetical protein
MSSHRGGLSSRPGLANGICGGQIDVGQVFSEYFGFPYQNHLFHQFLHYHHNHPGQLAESLRRADHPSKVYC